MAEIALLNHYLRLFEPFFKRKDVSDIVVNEPGMIWLDTNTGWEQIKTKAVKESLTQRKINSFVETLATSQGQKFSAEHPVLATTIPKHGFRIHAVRDTVAIKGTSLSIRVSAAKRFELKDYIDSQDDIEFLMSALETGQTIIVVGGTSSGKTTLLNTMTRYIPTSKRIITVEDAPELIVDQPNVVSLVKSKSGTDIGQSTYKEINDSIVRMRPDRIIWGELDIANSYPFLRIINTGHAGSMATLHANSPALAVDALVMNVQMSGISGAKEIIQEYVKKAVNIIVFIQRHSRTEYEAKVTKISEVNF